MFKTGHALPLRERRTSCPRMSRGGHAECPSNISRLWTWHRPVHGLDSAGNRTQTRTFSFREQSATAFRPRQQSCPRTIHVHAQATASIVHERVATSDVNCPQTVRSLEPSASMHSSWPEFSVNPAWHRIVRAGAFSFPFGRRHISRSGPESLPPLSSF
jgi:hypothetical protein